MIIWQIVSTIIVLYAVIDINRKRNVEVYRGKCYSSEQKFEVLILKNLL